jgi:hypothetical protein
VYLVGQTLLSVGFVRALRVAFSNLEQFRWDPDEQKSKINIYDDFPLIGLKYPSVVVQLGGGPGLLRGIGDEVASVDGSDVSIDGLSYTRQSSITYSGNMRQTVNLRVSARSSYERALIADWIDLFLRHFAVEQFQKEGVFIEDIQFGAGVPRLVGSDPVYEMPISVRCLTAFTREVAVSPNMTVNALCLTGVFTSLPDGTTYGETYA